jgi:hypothetical protein
MKNWDWCKEYRQSLGAEAIEQYVNSVYRMILSMAPDTYFSIEKNVKPENTDLFIKVCCMFIQEESASCTDRERVHTFNAACTEFKCINQTIK